MSNVERAAEVLARLLDEHYDTLHDASGAIAQALADAGLLAPDNAEVTTEYGVRFPNGEISGRWRDAVDSAGRPTIKRVNGQRVAVVQRTVTTIRTDWVEVADDA